MALGLRYRLRDRDGNLLKHKQDVCVAITSDGNPFVVDMSERYYPSVSFKDCKDYTLEVATTKVDGKWLYLSV